MRLGCVGVFRSCNCSPYMNQSMTRTPFYETFINSIIRSTFCFALVFAIFFALCGQARGDAWLTGNSLGQQVWIDTSHYVSQQRWIDTSHWEQRGQYTWVSTGYCYWIDNSHEDTVIAWMVSDPTWGWPAWGGRWWYQYADRRCPQYYGGLECYSNWTWGAHSHHQDTYCPGAGWRSIWWVRHDYGYWGWQDTSHYEWQIINVWIGSGYWENYQAWIVEGHWAEPLHGTVKVSKAPPFVFTRWHFMTSDGEQHTSQDEQAHLTLAVTGSFSKPIASVNEYAIVQRTNTGRDLDQIKIVSRSLQNPSTLVSLKNKVYYPHAGSGRHYFVFTASDGSTASLYCDIPINGYRSINNSEATENLPSIPFARSLQDVGEIEF